MTIIAHNRSKVVVARAWEIGSLFRSHSSSFARTKSEPWGCFAQSAVVWRVATRSRSIFTIWVLNWTSSTGAEFWRFGAFKVVIESRIVSSWARNEEAFAGAETCTYRELQITYFSLVLDIGTGSWNMGIYIQASFELSSHRLSNILDNFGRNVVGLHANNHPLVYRLEFGSHTKIYLINFW